MKVYQLHVKQALPINKKEAWEFLCDPNNLSVITPPELKMTIVSGADRKMYPGQILQYSVSPLPLLKSKWVSEISHYIEGNYFVDEQHYGPYAMWHHKHFIHEVKGGVIIEDLIHYKMPLGWFGQILQPIVVQPRLERIFKFRKSAIESIFGKLEL